MPAIPGPCIWWKTSSRSWWPTARNIKRTNQIIKGEAYELSASQGTTNAGCSPQTLQCFRRQAGGPGGRPENRLPLHQRPDLCQDHRLPADPLHGNGGFDPELRSHLSWTGG